MTQPSPTTTPHATVPRRPRGLTWLGIMLVSIVALVVLAACGSSSDSPTKTTAAVAGAAKTATATTASGAASTTVSGAASTVASAATQLSASPDIAQFSGIALQLATCAQQNTTGKVVTDLSAGKTDSAKQVYTDCVGTALPGPLASQAEPVVNDAVTCSETAAKGMSAADMKAAESGDQAAIGSLTNQTITCLLAKYGDLLR